MTLSETNQWVHTWNQLLENDEANQAITYTVEEVTNVEKYETTITQESENSIVIVNSYVAALTEVSGEKIWDDADNQDQKRPENIVAIY